MNFVKKLRVLIPWLGRFILLGLSIAPGFAAYTYKDNFYYILSGLFLALLPISFLKEGEKVSINNKTAVGKSFLPKTPLKFPHLRYPSVSIKKGSWLIFVTITSMIYASISIFNMSDHGFKQQLAIEYYSRLPRQILDYWWVSVLFTVVITFIYSRKLKKNRFTHKVKKVGINMLKSVGISAIGALTSLVFVYTLALVYIASISGLSIFMPAKLGFVGDSDKIVSAINNSGTIPKIASVDSSLKKSVGTKTDLIFKKGSFFANQVLSGLPDNAYSLIKLPDNQIFLVRNTIIVRSLDKGSIEKIAPTIGKLYVSKVYSPRLIKDVPNLSIVSRQEYLKYRDDQVNKQLREIQDLIDSVKNEMSTVASYISRGKANISELEGYVRISASYRDQEYQTCVSSTYTIYGYYSYYTYRSYTDEQCQSQRSSRDQEIARYQSQIKEEQNTLSYNQGVYAQLRNNANDLGSYQDFVNSYKSQTPYELGIFEPEKDIKVVLDSVDSKSLADFISTITHEYLHYTSYISEERSLPHFFEEGLTELLSRRIGRETLGIDTNLGYPLMTKIMERIADKVGWKELEQIYFTKNEDELVYLLDNKFGKNFYKDSENFFILIPYLPEEKALKYANNIMTKIDAKELTTEDFYSTKSNY